MCDAKKNLHTIDIELNTKKGNKKIRDVIKWDLEREDWWIPISPIQVLCASFDGSPVLSNEDHSKAWGLWNWVREETAMKPEEKKKAQKLLNDMYEKHVKNYRKINDISLKDD